MMLEATIEDAFVSHAEAKGCQALKLRIDGQNGWPDRTVITSKGVLFFEFKQKRGRSRAMQRFWRKVLAGLGHTIHVPRAVGEAERILDEYLKASH